MIRNLKVLGLAITAVLAMSAVWAVAAQASLPELQCTTEANTCTVTGTEIESRQHIFNVKGGNVRCRSSFDVTLRLTGTENDRRSGSTIPGVSASYTGCRAFGVAATVHMNECTYTFKGATDNNRVDTANVDIVCPREKQIEVTAPSIPCTITVPAQTGLQHVVFNNNGSEPTHVLANITVSGIEYTMDGVTCPERGGTFNDGTYNGVTTLEGFNDNGPESNNDGNPIGLHVITPAT